MAARMAGRFGTGQAGAASAWKGKWSWIWDRETMTLTATELQPSIVLALGRKRFNRSTGRGTAFVLISFSDYTLPLPP